MGRKVSRALLAGANPTEKARPELLSSTGVDPPRTSPRPARRRAARTSAAAAGAGASADDGASASGHRTAGYRATSPTAGHRAAGSTAAASHRTAGSTTAATRPRAAPAAAATALGYSLVKQASWSNLPVEDIEGRQTDVGEFLLVQRKRGKGYLILWHPIRGRRRRRCAAGDRQRRAGYSQERYRFPAMFSLRSLLVARHGGTSLCRRYGYSGTRPQIIAVSRRFAQGQMRGGCRQTSKFRAADGCNRSPVRPIGCQVAVGCRRYRDTPRRWLPKPKWKSPSTVKHQAIYDVRTGVTTVGIVDAGVLTISNGGFLYNQAAMSASCQKGDVRPVDRDERNTITSRVFDDPMGTREIAMADVVKNGVNVDALIAAAMR